VNETVRAQLGWIVATYGHSVCKDSRRVEALLLDLAGEHRREVSILVTAAKEGIPAELLASMNSVPASLLSERLTQTLLQNSGLTEEAARWAVATWESALDAAEVAAPEIWAETVQSAQEPTTRRAITYPPEVALSDSTDPAQNMSAQTRQPTARRSFRGWYVLAAILIFFGVAIWRGGAILHIGPSASPVQTQAPSGWKSPASFPIRYPRDMTLACVEQHGHSAHAHLVDASPPSYRVRCIKNGKNLSGLNLNKFCPRLARLDHYRSPNGPKGWWSGNPKRFDRNMSDKPWRHWRCYNKPNPP
jgi:hypothetical protein